MVLHVPQERHPVAQECWKGQGDYFGFRNVRMVAMDLIGFRNVLNAAMDAENLALAQEEATLTKIRTLLNQHKVGEACEMFYRVCAGETLGAPIL